MGRAGSARYCCGSSRKRDTERGSRSQNRLKKGRIFIRFYFGSWGGSRGAFQFRNRAQERELLGGAALQRCGSVLERSASAAGYSWPLLIEVIPVTGFISSLLAPSRRKICFSQTEWRDYWWKSCSTIVQSANICCMNL